MKRIYPNTDLYFNLTINNIPINSALVQGIDFEFYTTNRAINIKKTESDIDKLNNIILEWNELQKLETGVLFYSYHLKIQDPTQSDGKIDRVENVQTEFYICNDTQDNIDIPTENVKWGHIDGDINLQSDLIELIDSKVAEGGGSVDLSGYYTKQEIDTKGYLTSVPAEYITDTELNQKGYLTEHQSLANYATKAEIPTKTSELTNDSNYLTEHQSLANYATKAELPKNVSELNNDSGYLTEHQSLENYATKDELPKNTSDLVNDSNFITEIPAEYITDTELTEKGYLTEHQKLKTINGEPIVGTGNIEIIGGEGTKDYTLLTNKPQINSIELNGNKTLDELGIQKKGTYLTEVPAEYVTETELNQKGYLTEHQSLANYATKAEIPTNVSELTNDSGYLTEHQSLAEYVTNTQLTEKGYATTSYVDGLIGGASAKINEINQMI